MLMVYFDEICRLFIPIWTSRGYRVFNIGWGIHTSMIYRFFHSSRPADCILIQLTKSTPGLIHLITECTLIGTGSRRFSLERV